MVIDWHVHAGEAEFFERYPKYVDTFKKFWEPFIRLYHIDMFKMMNQSLDAKLRMLADAGVDRAVFIGLDLAPDFDFKIPIEYLAELQPGDVNLVYPAFSSIFTSTPLQAYLTMWGVRTLLLSGYHTEWCIETAARAVRDLGYMPIVIGDACAGETPEIHLDTLRRLDHIFAPAIATDTAIDLIRKGAGRLGP